MNYEYPPIGGGGGTVCKGLAEVLVRRGNEIDLVTSGMVGLSPFEEVEGVRLHRVRCYRRHRHYVTIPEMATQVGPAYAKALELTRRGGYDVNHTHFIVPSGLTSYLLWRRTGLPYVITIHGSDVPGYNPDRFQMAHRLLQPMWQTIVRNASCVISASRFLKRLVEEKTDRNVQVIPHGIDLPDPPRVPKRNRILAVTRMFERKGIQYMIEALDGLSTDWEVVIAGDGPYLPTLREMAQTISTPIDFRGFVQGDALWELYASAKVFVFPSIQENSPVVLLEAMNAGCAVITTTADGCAEMARDAAVKVKPASVPELRDAINRLIRDEAEVARLSHLGQARVEEFSSTRVARAHEEIFGNAREGFCDAGHN
jgi:glycosyltransferase involved in cell wall biosynthesis